ncbi:MAG: nicotinate phosphoribosyltransferase [Candidatus Harrisonbacteria bacterium]|nr:nicotinate phosphoribosyltransferase [Candidatus Harrisonbacteria bacterium]
MNTPIIRSLLDLDYYKLTMAQVAWKHYQTVPVRYSFKNRTKNVLLAEYINEEDLRMELDHVRSLRFTDEEIAYLRGLKIFSEDFLGFLKNLKLPEVVVARDGATYKIEVFGLWPEAIWWETLILSVVNELYYRSLLRKEGRSEVGVWSEGQSRLSRKIEILNLYPGIKFSDFGTRRRFSRYWQDNVIGRLVRSVPDQLLGTSNVAFAKRFGIRPIGTFAHEMDMVLSGVYHGSDDSIRYSHNKVLQLWWKEYGEPLSIALTDTYGTDFFFKDLTLEQVRKWRGFRQDSGDPFEFGEKAIAFYQKYGIDPKTKTIVFSDGLDVDMIVKLHERFSGRTNVVFGWGTNLTNDLGFKALSLVVKVTEANGHGTVKLSDNLAKAMGDSNDIERFKKIFGYTRNESEECKY